MSDESKTVVASEAPTREGGGAGSSFSTSGDHDESPMMRDIRHVVREELGTAKRLAARPDEAAESWELLEMVREQLVHSCGAEHMVGCPPMFYPEAIHNAIRKHVLIAIDGAVSAFLNSGKNPNALEVRDFTNRVEGYYTATLKVQRDKERAALVKREVSDG